MISHGYEQSLDNAPLVPDGGHAETAAEDDENRFDCSRSRGLPRRERLRVQRRRFPCEEAGRGGGFHRDDFEIHGKSYDDNVDHMTSATSFMMEFVGG